MSHGHALAMFERLERRSGRLSMRISKGLNFYFLATFGIPRDVPWTAEFKGKLLEIREAGFIDYFLDRYKIIC